MLGYSIAEKLTAMIAFFFQEMYRYEKRKNSEDTGILPFLSIFF